MICKVSHLVAHSRNFVQQFCSDMHHQGLFFIPFFRMTFSDLRCKTLILNEGEKISCDPAGIRTQDPNIKSVVLYRLSY